MHETEAGGGVGVGGVAQRCGSAPCAEIYVWVVEAATYVTVGEMDAEIDGEAGGEVGDEWMDLGVISAVVSVEFGPSVEPFAEPFEEGSRAAFG